MIARSDTAYRVSVLIDSRLPRRDQMQVGEPFTVELFDGRRVTVPAGFVTDCHSTPPMLHNILPAYDTRTNVAAIVHDFLYMHWWEFTRQHQHDEWSWIWLQLTSDANARRYADRAYLDLMERFKPGHWRNRLYYRAVRLFGGPNWRRFRRSE